jgi:thiosulfate/3-mercaptopyruvate sulfurtransferase
MAYTHLISVPELRALSDAGIPHLVFDCSFDLMQPQAARAMFAQAHIPGAVPADLDAHLSAHGAADARSGGRHPLPSRKQLRDWLRSVGLMRGMQAVVYDRNGCNFCGRLWWLLKWAGHDAVAILDGALQAWEQAGAALASGAPAASGTQGDFELGEPLVGLVGGDEMFELHDRPDQCVIDSRAGPRFRGEVEPLDPQAGHIPGALNRPFTDNFAGDGRFKPAEQLREEFAALLDGRNPAVTVVYCGSGVSAVPNLVALELAGFTGARLYAGSWSEWSRTPGRPVASEV